ncbi:MAG TPA: response regulator, partial [Rhodocyclaceae bacterium]|nr:response regulator [Rhodocyclaceae bacterium]
MADSFRVFVVDDDILMLEMVDDLLRDDCKVEAFISAQECLERLHQLKPDMFLLDISMPGVDGYDLCRILKERVETCDIPVTFISANDSAEARLMCYEAGGEDFITKPFSPDELLQKVQAAQRITANKRALHAQAGQAQQAAQQVMSSMNELAVIVQFFSRSFACKTLLELGTAMLDVLTQCGLDGAVQLRAGGEILSLSPNGKDLPLEVSVLNNVRTAGRIFQFKTRCVFNYDRVTLMVNNMPVENAERCGQIRDHGAILAEGAEARLAAMESDVKGGGKQTALIDALPKLRAAIEVMQESYRRNGAQLKTLAIEYQEELGKSIAGLGLTEPQERDLAELAHHYMQRITSAEDETAAAV